MTALKVALVVLLVLGFAVVGLRVRKLRRDEQRARFSKLDRRLVSPPPSPYQPSKGFRLLDDESPAMTRPELRRPRLEPAPGYVFSESPADSDEPAHHQLRHDAQWALARSAQRSRFSLGIRWLVVAIVAVAVLAGATYATRSHGSRHTTTTTASPTTSSTAATTTSTTFPTTFAATSTSGSNAFYDVPAAKYLVSVTSVAGPAWVVYRMGPQHTLEFQGRVAQGDTKTLEMTGDAQITLGSPGNVAVRVNASAVVLPTPLTSPLTLNFRSTPPTG
jgi:hypothetical protein